MKLLTPSPADFTPEYNAWLESIHNHIRALVFIIKRFYRPEWGDDWVSHFGVDIINGEPGHELKHEGRKLVANYLLRIGRDGHGAWRTYKLRQDFVAADKVQMEDDITASVVVPARRLVGPRRVRRASEPQAGAELRVPAVPAARRRGPPGARPSGGEGHGSAGLFCSNFQPLDRGRHARHPRGRRGPRRFTPPMREHVDRNAARETGGWSICSARPRIIGGKPTKNRATRSSARTWRDRATGTSPRWARG